MANNKRKQWWKKYYAEHKDKIIAYHKKLYWDNAEEVYFSMSFKRYGITREEHDVILKYQDGKCPLCNRKFDSIKAKRKSSHIDHDHRTGKIRGLLCRMCNCILHYFEDEEYSKRALEYLKPYESELK